MRSRLAIAGLTAVLATPGVASGQLNLLGSLNQTGGGLGSQLTVLTLLNPGGTTTESGCVSPTGFTACGYADANVQQGQSQVQALSQAALSGVNGSNLRVILNAAEPTVTNNLTLTGATLTLYSGSTPVFQRMLAAPVNLSAVYSGIGSFGFVFGLSGADAAAFDAAVAANSNLSIGFGASFANVGGGPETFSIAQVTNASVVPEPASFALLGSGMVGLGVVFGRRRRLSASRS